MEAQEEVVGSSKDQQTHIVKGKRTKRQRPQSPVPFAITTNSSSGDNDTNINTNTNTNTNLSPTTSAHEFILDSTEEEEDMANCLILLAQGQSPLKHIQEDKIEDGIYKFNSRRYIQDAPDNGKASGGGLSVYECKTCSRTFPSFQALGGHRASHKKLKAMAEEQNKKQFVLSDEEAERVLKNNFLSPPPLSLQLGNIRHSNTNNNKSNKVHECSVCGAEFTSGQALGGHMRRHRGPLMATNTSLSLTTTLEPEEESEAKKPTRNLLSLDLNLPAPEDDHHRESKFTFTATAKKQHQQQQQQQQSPALVFSAAPALVDCHY